MKFVILAFLFTFNTLSLGNDCFKLYEISYQSQLLRSSSNFIPLESMLELVNDHLDLEEREYFSSLHQKHIHKIASITPNGKKTIFQRIKKFHQRQWTLNTPQNEIELATDAVAYIQLIFQMEVSSDRFSDTFFYNTNRITDLISKMQYYQSKVYLSITNVNENSGQYTNNTFKATVSYLVSLLSISFTLSMKPLLASVQLDPSLMKDILTNDLNSLKEKIKKKNRLGNGLLKLSRASVDIVKYTAISLAAILTINIVATYGTFEQKLEEALSTNFISNSDPFKIIEDNPEATSDELKKTIIQTQQDQTTSNSMSQAERDFLSATLEDLNE